MRNPRILSGSGRRRARFEAPDLPRGATIDERRPISVVVVDDHLLLAETVAATLEDHDRITVVATVGTCADGAAAVRTHQPDVCLLDQRLPDGLGTELVPHLLASSPSTKVLLVTGDNAVEVVRDALRAGAIGVVGKGQRAAALARGRGATTVELVVPRPSG